MSNFSGLWKRQNNPACTKSVTVFIMLNLDSRTQYGRRIRSTIDGKKATVKENNPKIFRRQRKGSAHAVTQQTAKINLWRAHLVTVRRGSIKTVDKNCVRRKVNTITVEIKFKDPMGHPMGHDRKRDAGQGRARIKKQKNQRTIHLYKLLAS